MESSNPVSAVLQHKSSELFQIAPDATVYQAIEEMAQRNVGSLLVMESGKLVGLISERDYTRDVILKEKSSRTTPVREIMTVDLVSVSPSDTVEHCMELMTEKRFRYLPVLDNGELIGIVSIGDLVKWIISAQGALIKHLENFIKGGYPA